MNSWTNKTTDLSVKGTAQQDKSWIRRSTRTKWQLISYSDRSLLSRFISVTELLISCLSSTSLLTWSGNLYSVPGHPSLKCSPPPDIVRTDQPPRFCARYSAGGRSEGKLLLDGMHLTCPKLWRIKPIFQEVRNGQQCPKTGKNTFFLFLFKLLICNRWFQIEVNFHWRCPQSLGPSGLGK